MVRSEGIKKDESQLGKKKRENQSAKEQKPENGLQNRTHSRKKSRLPRRLQMQWQQEQAAAGTKK